MTRTIAIIGAAGDVGRDLAKDLIKITDSNLIIGDIQENKVAEAASAMGDRVSAMKVDVFNPATIDRLCEKSDLIVSCTGPSKIVVDKVALPALKHGLNYLDIGGSMDLYNALSDRENEIKNKGLTYLVSAGMSPGFTGTLPMYLMSNEFFDKVDDFKMNLGFSGGELSYTGCHDMLSGYLTRKSSSIWENGEWVPSQPKIVNLPEPFGQVFGSPVVEAEIVKYIEKKNPGSYSMHMSIISELTGMALGFVFGQQLYDETHIEASARFLSSIFKYDAKDKEPSGVLCATTTGEKNGVKKTIETSVAIDKDLNLTASCAAGYVKMVLENEIPEKGRFWAGEIANPEKYVSNMEKLGIMINRQET